MAENAFNLSVTLPAVLVGFGGHTNWRCKLLVVSGGVTRGRVARGVMGVALPKDMTPRAQAQKQPESRVKPYKYLSIFVFVVRKSFITIAELLRVS